ncbi:pentatricopeptide repeat-containing protein-like, mitochondrial [Iris pallida]|uniref:Pentatricopeptide repeat-containing protein-like, mitochondrial n=1 Tax=Iris pallida TaxID=29817 RepID=A0AAX6HSG7_IRIPA|nr:pentatricopeptide repeat-containing protein-like, mitochondrial [Iris pallida]
MAVEDLHGLIHFVLKSPTSLQTLFKPLQAALLRHHAPTSLYNTLIQTLSSSNSHSLSLSLYSLMLTSSSSVPDALTFPPLLKSCSRLRDLPLGRSLHCHLSSLALRSDVSISNSLISFYSRCGLLASSRQVFDGMPRHARNVVTWTSLIGAYVRHGQLESALSLFRAMLDSGIRPNRPTFLSVIPCVSDAKLADDLCRLISDEGLDGDGYLRNAVVRMYMRCGKIDYARKLFDSMEEKDLVTWSLMVDGYGRADMYFEALELFREMKVRGIFPDYVALLGLIRACVNSTMGSLAQARFVHGITVRSLLDRNVMVGTALVDLYVKRGRLRTARRLFDRMEEKSLVTWSTMISGYGMHGFGKDALDLFDRMKDLVRPDHIVFVAVLSACSHAGLIDQGWRCFYSMERDFGVVPRAEHYACMIDLLGRAGKLTEAQEFIERMPIPPDSSVWGSLLGACRIHPDEKVAEFAARSLFEMDSENSGRYILLSNVYTSLGKIKEANRIRSLMKRRGVKKTAGYSVIEVKNKTYKFLVGDETNPNSGLIYRELEKLMDRIREAGYVPNTNFALHDLEEETKERSLYVHSEKLAIVFGLMYLGPDSEIRIHKNLRVCGDCHNATKFISEVTGREILVRDSHRFHHFSGGRCSCGDYW